MPSHLLSLFFTDTATTEIYTLSLHDALPILRVGFHSMGSPPAGPPVAKRSLMNITPCPMKQWSPISTSSQMKLWDWTFVWLDRKSTRLNSSHPSISYAVFCLKKKIENK